MQVTAQRDTPGERAMRSAIHRLGLRFSVDRRPLSDSRRRADLVFRSARVAVFIDGCFWHGCPRHGTWPKTNRTWWRAKIEANRRRDADTDEVLAARGWAVVRLWAHDDMMSASRKIATLVRRRRAS